MNVETLLVAALDPLLSVPVSTDVPQHRPDKFVTIERTGGGDSEHGILDTSLVAVQCWAPTRTQAGDLAETVRAAMHMLDAPNIARVTINSLYNFPLDDTQPRYQITAEIVVHNMKG